MKETSIQEKVVKNNIVIFAHYDKNNCIDDYVIYYLEQLKLISKYIIFVSDSDLNKEELHKLNNIADYSIAKKHGEYDFGSYKKGFKLAKQKNLLEQVDNLILCNDSCYGPFYPFEEIFKTMDSKNCDFWGITQNINRINKTDYPCNEANNKHIPSYFMVLKKQVFKSLIFEDFIEAIAAQPDKETIIVKYEIGLTAQLCQAGFKFDTIFDKPIIYYNLVDLSEIDTKYSIFMKKETLRQIYFIKLLENWFNKLKINKVYPIKFIKENFKRNRSIKDFKFAFVKKCIVRIHMKELKIFILGRWYDFSKNKELKNV